jgi:hypothetical protein
MPYAILSQSQTNHYFEVIRWIAEHEWTWCDDGLFLLPIDDPDAENPTEVVDQLRTYINEFQRLRFLQYPNGMRIGMCPARARVNRDGQSVLANDKRPTLLLHKTRNDPQTLVIFQTLVDYPHCLPIVSDAWPQRGYLIDANCAPGESFEKYVRKYPIPPRLSLDKR